MKMTADSFNLRKNNLTIWKIDPGLKEHEEVTCTTEYEMIFSTEFDTDSQKLIYNVVKNSGTK